MGTDANALAKDIQTNVDTIALDKGQGAAAQKAEQALYSDAYGIGYKAWASPQSEPKAVQQLQANVQADLKTLEEKGHLPAITINDGDLLIKAQIPASATSSAAEVGVDMGQKGPSVLYQQDGGGSFGYPTPTQQMIIQRENQLRNNQGTPQSLKSSMINIFSHE